MASPFLLVFVAGASVLALWIDTRFPSLAPQSLSTRVLAAAGAVVLLQAAPVIGGSAAAIYATVFALVLPALIGTFLTSVWVLRALRDAQLSS